MPFWRRRAERAREGEERRAREEAARRQGPAEERDRRERSWDLLPSIEAFDPGDEAHRTLFDAICEALQEALLVEERSRVGEGFHSTATLIDSDFRGQIAATTTRVSYKGVAVIDHDDAAGRMDVRLGPWWPELRERQLANRGWLEETLREFGG